MDRGLFQPIRRTMKKINNRATWYFLCQLRLTKILTASIPNDLRLNMVKNQIHSSLARLKLSLVQLELGSISFLTWFHVHYFQKSNNLDDNIIRSCILFVYKNNNQKNKANILSLIWSGNLNIFSWIVGLLCSLSIPWKFPYST